MKVADSGFSLQVARTVFSNNAAGEPRMASRLKIATARALICHSYAWLAQRIRAIWVPPFMGNQPGPSTPIHEGDNELALFFRFFSQDLLLHIVEETNRYAAAKIATSEDRNWFPLSVKELKAYFGIRVYMSVLY